MRSFFEMVGFEYKKIFKRKSAAITIILIIIISVLSPAMVLTGNVYVDGEPVETSYEAMQKDRGHTMALSDKIIGEELFTEVKQSYSNIPMVERYTITPEYELYGRPYYEIYRMMRSVYTGLDVQSLQNLNPDKMQNFYKLRHEQVIERTSMLKINDKSKERLIQLDSKINTPWKVEYTEGYQRFFVIMYSTGIFIIFAATICIAPIFSGEYNTGASQLILSSRYGKNRLISAKIVTAVSFCAALCLTLTAATYFVCLSVYGFYGANAPLQLCWRFFFNIYPLTMLQAAVIFSICIFFAMILVTSITLFLSSKIKSPFGVIIITNLLIFVPMMLSVSDNNILLFNLYRLLPSNMMAAEAVFSYIPFEIFGQAVMPYVFLPVFSVLLIVTILPFAWRAFKNYQQ